jgi:hypothetical protein
MNDEFSPFDLQPNPWAGWMPDARLSGAPKPPAPPEVPARIAFDWTETPNGGLIGRPNPLWHQSNSHWWDSIPAAPFASGRDGILGSLSVQPGLPSVDPSGLMRWQLTMPLFVPAMPTRQFWDGPSVGLGTTNDSDASRSRLNHFDAEQSWRAAAPRMVTEPMSSSDT